MMAFVTLLAGVCIGYVLCIWFPPMKPQKEIKYVERMPRLDDTRAFPQHPPLPHDKAN